MSKRGSIRRYSLIIEKIGRNRRPTFSEVKDHLHENDFKISDRTLQRDIEAIRVEFGVDIQYNRAENYYFIESENDVNSDNFFRFLGIVNTAEFLTESIKDSKDTLKYIMFESQGNMKGVEFLKPLLMAIKSKKKVSFIHESFVRDEERKHNIEPYLLKEYQNRWYLIGMYSDTRKFRTFGIDRIRELEVSETSFEGNPNKNPTDLFYHTIGLTYSYNKVEDVILSFTHFQGKYIKSLPMHETQEILIDNDEELRIRLKIIPNYELEQKILMLGDTVTVIEPKELVDNIKNSLKNTLKNYKKE
ncbi:MAG: WYL domain-containing protein [Bacteroidales bacterium]|nr:WYL domain-containing protein [Bacteroidales bacterium]